MTRHWSAMVRGPSHCISRVHPYAHARTRARESIRRNGLVRGPLRTTYAELPLFKCDRIEPNPTIPEGLIVSFECPSCRARHWHSWGKDEPRDIAQHRAAHCWRGSMRQTGGYWIVIGEDAAR
jgi:hypothetical protein